MSDPIIETPPPIEVEIVTGAATPLSTDTPEDLGTAAAGVSMEASRSDHVHAMPSAADVTGLGDALGELRSYRRSFLLGGM